MACLRDIQRLFASRAKDAFFAGFGNRITDAMSYRSVGIPTSKIYTIDSTGVLKTELLQSAHKGSYMGLNDLVNEMFPPVTSKFQPEFTDFNYWRDPIADIALPDLSPLAPPSPALSARSDASGNSRLSYLGGFMRRGSRAASPDATSQPGSPRPSSPLMGPVLSASDLSEGEEEEHNVTWSAAASSGTGSVSPSRSNSMPGSFEEGAAFPAEWLQREDSKADFRERHTHAGENGDDHGDEDEEDYDDDDIFDDDILATGEMARVPF
jgi:phosphatidate phosphatase LPIN